mmetsp:Transcript_5658/g.7230  ORF Transcript_5658/g.7230 Transcript_5658/m.7230 type:complete len:477 (+) Transcript_5658:104-1534(+)
MYNTCSSSQLHEVESTSVSSLTHINNNKKKGSSRSSRKITDTKNAFNNAFYMRSPAALSWRLDPEESLSDWKISVFSSSQLCATNNLYMDRFGTSNLQDKSFETDVPTHRKPISQTKIYFVHRAQIAVGPRKSEYFANIFKRMNSYRDDGETRTDSSDGRNNSVRNITKIELTPQAASCFPVMLDFMYSLEGTPLAITTESAVALRQLASSFGVRALFRETTDFIKGDLCPRTAVTYLIDAIHFQNLKLRSAAIEVIARNFFTIKVTTLVTIPPKLMADIIQSGHLHTDESTRIQFSTKIASYCRCREDELTLSILESLSPKFLMTKVDDKESLYFLHLIFSLQGKSLESDLENLHLYNSCLNEAPKYLHKLQHSKPWTKGSLAPSEVRQHRKDLELYNSLPAETKVYLLERSFNSLESQKPEKSVPVPSFGDKKAREQVSKLQDEVKLLQLSYEKKVNYYQRKLDAKEEELKRHS